MKPSVAIEKHRGTSRTANIAGRRRQINSHWTPVERGRRLLIAAARQAELYAAIGLGQLNAHLPTTPSDYAASRFSPIKAGNR